MVLNRFALGLRTRGRRQELTTASGGWPSGEGQEGRWFEREMREEGCRSHFALGKPPPVEIRVDLYQSLREGDSSELEHRRAMSRYCEGSDESHDDVPMDHHAKPCWPVRCCRGCRASRWPVSGRLRISGIAFPRNPCAIQAGNAEGCESGRYHAKRATA